MVYDMETDEYVEDCDFDENEEEDLTEYVKPIETVYCHITGDAL